MSCGGGCGCAPCSPSALELAANPNARKLAGLSQPMTIGSWNSIGKFKGDVDALKRDIHPAMVATDVAVASCTAVTPQERVAWAEFFKAWNAFHAEETPTLIGVGRRYDEAIEFRTQLMGWQDALRGKCTLAGPLVSPLPTTPTDAIVSAVKWAAIAVIVAGGAYLASPLVIGARKLAK